MRINAGVGAVDHLHAGLQRLAEILALDFRYLAILAQVVFHDAVLRALGLRVVRVVYVHREIRAHLLRGGDAGVVDQAGVFDGVDAGERCVADA